MHIEREVRDFIANELARDVQAVSADESLLDAGVIDSLGMLALIAFIEKQYGIAVTEDEMMPENFDSLHAIAGFIARRQEPERV